MCKKLTGHNRAVPAVDACTSDITCLCGVSQSQVDNEANQAKEAFFNKALQDLVLFKSKTNAALLQVT